jgi:hypothetical protein
MRSGQNEQYDLVESYSFTAKFDANEGRFNICVSAIDQAQQFKKKLGQLFESDMFNKFMLNSFIVDDQNTCTSAINLHLNLYFNYVRKGRPSVPANHYHVEINNLSDMCFPNKVNRGDFSKNLYLYITTLMELTDPRFNYKYHEYDTKFLSQTLGINNWA